MNRNGISGLFCDLTSRACDMAFTVGACRSRFACGAVSFLTETTALASRGAARRIREDRFRRRAVDIVIFKLVRGLLPETPYKSAGGVCIDRRYIDDGEICMKAWQILLPRNKVMMDRMANGSI